MEEAKGPSGKREWIMLKAGEEQGWLAGRAIRNPVSRIVRGELEIIISASIFLLGLPRRIDCMESRRYLLVGKLSSQSQASWPSKP